VILILIPLVEDLSVPLLVNHVSVVLDSSGDVFVIYHGEGGKAPLTIDRLVRRAKPPEPSDVMWPLREYLNTSNGE